MIWVRCTGCNFRYKAEKGSQNVGYYHDHDNRITGGRGLIKQDRIKQSSVCRCGETIHLSSTGEWFHEVPAQGDWDDITGEVECDGYKNPVATPKVDYSW